MHDRVVLTSRAGTLVQTLGSAHSWDGYPISFRPCTLMGFVVTNESALRTRVYFSLRALAHFLERGVQLNRQVSYALPDRHT